MYFFPDGERKVSIRRDGAKKKGPRTNRGPLFTKWKRES
jgi:hypothetical protein